MAPQHTVMTSKTWVPRSASRSWQERTQIACWPHCKRGPWQLSSPNKTHAGILLTLHTIPLAADLMAQLHVMYAAHLVGPLVNHAMMPSRSRCFLLTLQANTRQYSLNALTYLVGPLVHHALRM
jgi:hypothetical protein